MRELEEAQRKLDEMKLAVKQSSYKPPQTCLETYQDPEFFNFQYQKYIDQLT